MSKPVKIALAVLTAWPIVYMLGFTAFVMSMFVGGARAVAHPPSEQPFGFGEFATIAVLHVTTMLIIFGLLVLYIVHLFRSNVVDQDKKALWAVVLILGNMLAMPVYWYLFVWREPVAANRAAGAEGKH